MNKFYNRKWIRSIISIEMNFEYNWWTIVRVVLYPNLVSVFGHTSKGHKVPVFLRYWVPRFTLLGSSAWKTLHLPCTVPRLWTSDLGSGDVFPVHFEPTHLRETETVLRKDVKSEVTPPNRRTRTRSPRRYLYRPGTEDLVRCQDRCREWVTWWRRVSTGKRREIPEGR